MTHVVLLGDSIFDNAAYVPGGLSVTDHLQPLLEAQGQRAADGRPGTSLLAVDGACIRDVWQQLKAVPKQATHLVLSVGGNDTLRYAAQLQTTRASLPEALQVMASMKTDFNQQYTELLQGLAGLQKPITLCTIYDQCPVQDPSLQLLMFTALSMFNDGITRQAIERGWPLIDLRVVCSEATDYAATSPIEPSESGGHKIARCIATVVSQHDFSNPRSVCYGGGLDLN